MANDTSSCDPLTEDEIDLYMTLSWWFEGLLQVRKTSSLLSFSSPRGTDIWEKQQGSEGTFIVSS